MKVKLHPKDSLDQHAVNFMLEEMELSLAMMERNEMEYEAVPEASFEVDINYDNAGSDIGTSNTSESNMNVISSFFGVNKKGANIHRKC